MKRLILSLLIAFCGAFSLQALSYEDARREAWFLTDKMAYELNLTPEQCDIVYQINFDYFLSIRRANDCRGNYWYFRNQDFRYVMFPWQYNLYVTLDYFYYPIRWVRSSWYYPICHRYHTGYYYFDCPTVYVSYRGSNWNRRSRKSCSPYRDANFRTGVGLRDRYYEGNGFRGVHHTEHGSSTRPSRNGSRYDRENPYYGNVNNRDNNRYDGVNRSDNKRNESNRNNHNDRVGHQNNRNTNYRPSREYGVGRNSSNRGSQNNSRENTSVDRGTREFGR